MRRLLLTIVLLATVTVAAGACRGTADVSGNPYTRKTNTVRPRKAVKCKTCTVFKYNTPKKRRAKNRGCAYEL